MTRRARRVAGSRLTRSTGNSRDTRGHGYPHAPAASRPPSRAGPRHCRFETSEPSAPVRDALYSRVPPRGRLRARRARRAPVAAECASDRDPPPETTIETQHPRAASDATDTDGVLLA